VRAQLSPGLVGASCGTTPRLASASTACGPAFYVLLPESAAGPGSRGARPDDATGTSLPVGAVIRRTDAGARRSPRDGRVRFRDRARVDGRLFTPSLRPATNKSYDEGLEFPCLMSHWRTWSTFTTFSAEIGITIQGFSVT
jgi:hypothetical protein